MEGWLPGAEGLGIIGVIVKWIELLFGMMKSFWKWVVMVVIHNANVRSATEFTI